MNGTTESVCVAERSGNDFASSGFRILSDVISIGEAEALAAELTELFERDLLSSRTRIGGVRTLLRASRCAAEFARSSRLCNIVDQFIGDSAFPIRALFFDKNVYSNWRVPWHQDLTIAVTRKIETDGFGPWSVKDGVIHVQPPINIMEGMVTLRLHLDDCNAENGALRVIPGSHQNGELTSDAIAELTKTGCDTICEVSRGGALLMRPLLLHASSSAKQPSHRRVLHIEYANCELPNGLEWFER